MIDDGGGLSGISGANALGLGDDAGFGITEESLSDGFTATSTSTTTLMLMTSNSIRDILLPQPSAHLFNLI